jgi:AraC-like DNA-binding protein
MHAQVRGVVLQLMGSEACSNTQVAAALHLHPRTLHRRLKAEGRTFQEIKDEVRRDVALYYLQRTDVDLTHIAQRLGYAEHSVLTRSCARWFSASPSRLRSKSRDEDEDEETRELN